MCFKNDPFSVLTPKTETFENAQHSFVDRLLITMAFKVAIGAFMAAVNERHCFEMGIDNTVLLEQCERLSYSCAVYHNIPGDIKEAFTVNYFPSFIHK